MIQPLIYQHQQLPRLCDDSQAKFTASKPQYFQKSSRTNIPLDDRVIELPNHQVCVRGWESWDQQGTIGAEQGGLRLAGEGQLESLKTRNLGPSTHLHCTALSSPAYFASYRNYSTQPQTRHYRNTHLRINNLEMSDFVPPSGPPPPKVPEGWKAQWNEQYSEWFVADSSVCIFDQVL